MENKQQCIDVCNSLLRGELSAIETYTQAIDKFGNDPENSALDGIRGEHEANASALRQHIVEMGAEPAGSSGAWGGFATAIEGAAKVLGRSPALGVLQQGEEHGIERYREALANEGVMEDIKVTIRQQLLPSLNEHVAALQRIQNL
jgi:Domain of unknown function (DUF2383)